jgi:hypothetical protein
MLIALLGALTGCAPRAVPDTTPRYSGMSDASAAVALNETTIIVGDDERNVFGIYRTDRPGLPLQTVAWDAAMDIDAGEKSSEADIEGAARLGDRIYWITSHGRNKDGKWRANRPRFFAMTVVEREGHFDVRPFGTAYRDLAKHMAADERLKRLGLDEALGRPGKTAKRLAPKEDGLNIEALSASADGRSLLIGLRNPRPEGKALVIPLLNPADVVTDGADPKFDDPILLELGSSGKPGDALGLRSMEFHAASNSYLLVASRHDERSDVVLYRWSGRREEHPAILPRSTAAVNRLPRFAPEAIVVYPARPAVELLSDDGTLKVRVASPMDCQVGMFNNGVCEAKHLIDPARQTFRRVVVDPTGD